MIMRRERLGKKPAVFRALTGLTVAVFDQFVAELSGASAKLAYGSHPPPVEVPHAEPDHPTRVDG